MMNTVRYFVGTRKKQWRFVSVCIVLTMVGYLFWLAPEWIINSELMTDARKIRKPPKYTSKLWSHLFGVRATERTLEDSSNSRVFNVFENPSSRYDDNAGGFNQEVKKRIKNLPPKLLAKRAGGDKKLEAVLSQSVSYDVHIFYYPWYGNPEFDSRYMHWNHKYLPHWNPQVAKKYKSGAHVPPNDIGSDFYPELGCYSSSDPNTIEEHMGQIRSSGAGVVVVSWYPKTKADDQGKPVDALIPRLLDTAERYGLKVTLHIEPYKDRSEETVREDVTYIIEEYSNHPAFYKYKTKDNHTLPLLYVYDSYHTKPHQWAKILKPGGSHTIRNTPYDCIMIALMVELTHREFIEDGGFDGFYTYFAVNGFTYGSRWNGWSNLKSFAKQSNSIFIPSVGPGYVDTSIRPWNSENTRSRQDGAYYKKSFKAALAVDPPLISITSFNEWHEGTQIEKAVPRSSPGFKYQDYLPHNPDYYLELTRKFVEMFR